MNRKTGTALILLSACAALNLFAQTPSPDELLRLAERVIFPSVYQAEMTIETEKPGQRGSTLEMETLYKEGSGSFIEMTAPARSRGIRFLEKGDSLYMYNPKSNSSRPLRLSPEQSFQGTVFSNNDVSDQQYTDDYDASLAGEETLEHPDFGSVTCRILEAVAKRSEAPYGRIKIYIDVENLRPLRFDYYAKSGLLFKSMLLKDYKQMAGKLRPAIMHMESYELEGAYSKVIINTLEALEDIPDSRFTTAALTR
jgi:outer membrane lipoprotein-sorting protein